MEKDTNIVLRVNSSLKDNVTNIVKKEGFTLSQVITACLCDLERRKKIPLNLYSHLPHKSESVISISEIKKCLDQIMAKNQSDGKINKVYLFGSYARGQANSKSDVDIRIETERPFSLVDLGNFHVDLEKKLQKKVDIVTQVPERMDPVFYDSIKKDEICLYERKR